jgi:hypothetical protein
MTIDITTFIMGAILLLFGLLARYAVPALKAQLTDEQELQLNYWATVFVQAAEEAKRTGILHTGEEQFAYVKKMLEQQGFTYDDDTLEALINGKVWELINSLKPEAAEVKVGGSE